MLSAALCGNGGFGALGAAKSSPRHVAA